MSEYSRPLGKAVKAARTRLGLTQCSVADAIHIDDRTILNIENCKGNPKMEILYPLVRSLKIDPCEIFYPEMLRTTPKLQELRLLVEDCDEQEAAALIPVLRSVLLVIRSKDATPIK